MCDNGLGVGSTKLAVYLDFKDVINREGENWLKKNMAIYLICINKLRVLIHIKTL